MMVKTYSSYQEEVQNVPLSTYSDNVMELCTINNK